MVCLTFCLLWMLMFCFCLPYSHVFSRNLRFPFANSFRHVLGVTSGYICSSHQLIFSTPGVRADDYLSNTSSTGSLIKGSSQERHPGYRYVQEAFSLVIAIKLTPSCPVAQPGYRYIQEAFSLVIAIILRKLTPSCPVAGLGAKTHHTTANRRLVSNDLQNQYRVTVVVYY